MQRELVFQTHLFFGENVLKQVNRFVSHSSSHTLSNVHCILHTVNTDNRALSCQVVCLEEAKNIKNSKTVCSVTCER